MRFNPISVSATRLNLFYHDVPLGSATGFFYKFGQDVALVTNWHVLAGRNPITNAYLDPRGYTPNRLEFALNLVDASEFSVLFRAADICLSRDDAPIWFQHEAWTKSDGSTSMIDVAIIDLSLAFEDYGDIKDSIAALSAHMVINASGPEDKWTAAHGLPPISSEVFILGFPRGFGKNGTFPIWKRGSIASEPLFYNDDGEPIILIDALTRSGMSGSPVLYFGRDMRTDVGVPFDRKEDVLEPWIVGVYAGRDGATSSENDMALSRVWRREVLDQIFFDRCPGGRFYPSVLIP